MITFEKINIELLKRFLGDSINLNVSQKGNKFFCDSSKTCSIVKKDDAIVIELEEEKYLISKSSGNYYLLDYKSADNFHRYIFNIDGEKALFVFKKALNEEEILHLLLSIFFIEKIL
ncbi:hypothetical protein H17ap60334_01321 [Thermosipho africanus H17ap60334]|jgi:hypothetical protein|uniref:Uncharacterized protein n=1 Tax=Thermosipho africanus (strain TCF52B) TaxID=484019 RepID=B7IGZ5_THEAB|nr:MULTISPECIES: hypothetical protein [Thermosipho]HCF38685.1 hypothetical protein [Thermosipho africanus]ACJ75359.1 hypothetical protein THA_900 [Thermosipho africanus TCF52B]EKF50178.1 hypothetical protein H17ap60334_01321 [Thermosipho africanus H17ap60334]MBZ4651090.1 hypothetical protein [Thermosipho sp. (in: thermotogales)]MDK2839905.1 hypothetical protein [Thermosipho sp. (in: thermotogales)]